EAGLAKSVTGVDWDEGKLQDATKAAGDLPMKFEKADFREVTPPACDTLLLIDVLHYLTDKQQLDVLARCMRATRKQEAVTTFFGYNVGERVRVLPIASFTELLEGSGFCVRVEPSWGKTPF